MASGGDGERLPGVIVQLIFGLIARDASVGIQTLIKLSFVCKKWYSILEGDEKIWRTMATTLSTDCFPVDLELPTSLLFSSCRQRAGSPHPCWRSVCELYYGWRKAFVAQAELQPELSEELSTLCEDVLPSVSKDCERRFTFAIRSHEFLSDYLVKQRHTADLPDLQGRLITSSHFHSQFIIVSIEDGRDGPSTLDLHFPGGISRECDRMWGNNFVKPLHRRRVGKLALQKIFAECGLGTFDSGCHDEHHHQMSSTEERLEDDVDEVYVVLHNIHGNLTTWDLWVVQEEPDLCAYWQESLVYSKVAYNSGPMVIKCVRAGIREERWGVNINFIPTLLEVNSQYVALTGTPREALHITLLLLSIQTGQQIHSVNVAASDWITQGMLLTDGFLVLNVCDKATEGGDQKQSFTVYGLPDLEPLYSLPSPLKFHEEPMCFMALSTCGRYLGVSTSFGNLVIYDMLAGSIKYCGSSAGYSFLEEDDVDDDDTAPIEGYGQFSNSEQDVRQLGHNGGDLEDDGGVDDDGTTSIESYGRCSSSEQDTRLNGDGDDYEDDDGTTPIEDCGLCCDREQEMRLYDEAAASTINNGDGSTRTKHSFKRKVGDGFWLWYKDVKTDDGADRFHEQVVEEKIVYWQLSNLV